MNTFVGAASLVGKKDGVLELAKEPTIKAEKASVTLEQSGELVCRGRRSTCEGSAGRARARSAAASANPAEAARFALCA